MRYDGSKKESYDGIGFQSVSLKQALRGCSCIRTYKRGNPMHEAHALRRVWEKSDHLRSISLLEQTYAKKANTLYISITPAQIDRHATPAPQRRLGHNLPVSQARGRPAASTGVTTFQGQVLLLGTSWSGREPGQHREETEVWHRTTIYSHWISCV
jgi:hypothetical protein